MINPVTRQFYIAQYEDKGAISIDKLVETTWLSRFPRPIEIMYDQGNKFNGQEFRRSLIEM